MKFGTARVVWMALVLLLGVEFALEYRAYKRGWSTLIFGAQNAGDDAGASASKTQSGWGPTDSFPFLSRELAQAKPEGVQRVWFSSSSHAADKRMAAATLFPNQIADIFAQQQWPLQMLNASEAGTSIVRNIDDLLDYGAHWQPDFVLLYQMSNDMNRWPTLSTAQMQRLGTDAPPPPPPGLSQRGTAAVSEFFERTTSYELLKGFVTPHLVKAKVKKMALTEFEVATYERGLRRFIRKVQGLNAQPVLVTFSASHSHSDFSLLPEDIRQSVHRWNEELSPKAWYQSIARLNQLIRDVAADEGVAVIDLAEEIRGEPGLFLDFVHFNEQGHERVAKYLAEQIRALQLVAKTGAAA